MSTAQEKEYAHLGETRGMDDNDHDSFHALSRRLECIRRYEQYIANAEKLSELQTFRRDAKSQEQKNITLTDKLVQVHVRRNCF